MMTFDDFLAEKRKDPEFSKEYDALEAEFAAIQAKIDAEKETNLTAEKHWQVRMDGNLEDRRMYEEIRGFIDADGRLTALPAKRRKKYLALSYLADRIPPEGRYTEREFNALLTALHTFSDPATLRREMYDCFLIDRDGNGENYRLSPDRPSAEKLIAEKCK